MRVHHVSLGPYPLEEGDARSHTFGQSKEAGRGTVGARGLVREALAPVALLRVQVPRVRGLPSWPGLTPAALVCIMSSRKAATRSQPASEMRDVLFSLPAVQIQIKAQGSVCARLHINQSERTFSLWLHNLSL